MTTPEGPGEMPSGVVGLGGAVAGVPNPLIFGGLRDWSGLPILWLRDHEAPRPRLHPLRSGNRQRSRVNPVPQRDFCARYLLQEP